MRKLRITAIAVVTVLVLAALAGPALIGRYTTRQLDASLAAISRLGPFELHYTPTQRGWFGQQGTLGITPRAAPFAGLMPAGQPLTVQLHVAYGPFPFAAWKYGFTLWPALAVVDLRSGALDAALTKAGSGYTLRDTLGLLGGNHGRVTLRAGTYHSADGGSLSWRPLRLHTDDVAMHDGMLAGDFRLHWGGLQFAKAGPGGPGQVRVGTVELTGSTRFRLGIPVGDYRIRLDSLEAQPPAPAQRLWMREIRLDGGASVSAPGFADSRARLEIGSLTAGTTRIAPVVFAMDLAHLAIPAYMALIQAVRQAQRESPPGTPPLLAAQHSMAAIQPPLLRLLAQHPVLHLTQLRVGMPQGAFTGSGQTALAALPAGATLDAPTMLKALQAHFTFRVPQALALHLAREHAAQAGAPPAQQSAMAQQMLLQLVQRGILRRQGDDYVMDLTIAQGAVQLNGRTIRQL